MAVSNEQSDATHHYQCGCTSTGVFAINPRHKQQRLLRQATGHPTEAKVTIKGISSEEAVHTNTWHMDLILLD